MPVPKAPKRASGVRLGTYSARIQSVSTLTESSLWERAAPKPAELSKRPCCSFVWLALPLFIPLPLGLLSAADHGDGQDWSEQSSEAGRRTEIKAETLT